MDQESDLMETKAKVRLLEKKLNVVIKLLDKEGVIEKEEIDDELEDSEE